ncbi:MAG TPA: TRAP transporter substrate-binding protein [Ramlibacter sp.]|nr:TRAP transporter substrate-binding protein [Ramlibacter sp.]
MKQFTRRNILSAGAALTGAFYIQTASSADFKYKLGLELRDDEALPKRMLAACKAIAADTQGRLQIQGFPNGQLGNAQETLSQVRSGSLEFLTSSFGLLSGVVPTAGMPTLGFIFDSYDKVWQAIDGELGQFIARDIEKRGELVVLKGVHDIGFRHITSSRRFMTDPKDLKGFKIRTPPSPFLTSLFSALGASPTPIAFGDLYTSLQTGTVDGQENPLTVVDSFKFYEVQKYCTLTSHTWDGWVPVANKRAWERLPEDIRQVVARHFLNAAIEQRKDIAAQGATMKAGLEKKGMQFQAPAAGAYQTHLRGTNFYPQWKSRIGAEGWAVLERAVGKLA